MPTSMRWASSSIIRWATRSRSLTRPDHGHSHPHGLDHHHTHDHEHGHSHLPPGTDGSPVTWRSLLGLGVSGGLLPCLSALLLLLTAVSLNRAALGMVLVVA